MDVTLQPVIFLVVFTYVLGGAISGGSQHDYLQYLLPGILGQTIAQAGVAIGVNLNTDLEKGVFDRFRSLPISRAAPLVGAVIADVLRYALLTVVILGFGYVLGFRVETGVLQAVAACLLAVSFALCLCWISVWIGMVARTPGAVQGITFLAVLPLSFASSTFANPDTMPGWLQTVTEFNPLSQLVDAVRGLLLGGPVGAPVWHTLLAMAVLLVVFVPLALRAYARRV
jgi:oleandomycin transport system permease protein